MRTLGRLFFRISGGYFFGFAHRIFYDDDLKVPIFLTACSDLLYNLAVYGLQFLLRGRMGLLVYLSRIILPEVIYTVFLTILVYRIFYVLNYRLMTPTMRERESSWVIKE